MSNHHKKITPQAPLPEETLAQEKRRDRRLKLYSEDLFALDTDVPESHWAVPWSDLMMTMFVLFVVLFVYASAKMDYLQAFRGHVEFETVDKVSEVGTREGEVPAYDKHVPGLIPDVGPQQLFESCQTAVDESGLTNVSVQLDGETIKISMHGPMLFDSMEADVKPEGRRFLDTVAKIIAKARYNVHVHGHTDNSPISTKKYPSNWDLSIARALKVGNYLMLFGHVNPAQITVSGHSMYKPHTPNLTPEGEARNRRVEIELNRPEEPPTTGELP